jgi:hypothetical protein
MNLKWICFKIKVNARPLCCKQATKCYIENIEEPPQRAVRANRGQGGHAFQLENAIKPNPQRTKGHKNTNSIPETIPENSMAPPPRQSRKENKVNSIFYVWFPT